MSTIKDTLISVCLFGSSVKGKLRKGSDVDFFVVLESAPTSYHKRVKVVVSLLEEIRQTEEYRCLGELKLELEPSFLLLTREEVDLHPPILIDMSYEGVILYDKDDFLANHLSDIKDQLNRFGAIKKASPTGYYWLVKPHDDIRI
jgi:predicted nucleotidyltransferase